MRLAVTASICWMAGFLLPVVLLLSCQVSFSQAAKASSTDVFLSPYPTIADPPSQGFLLWSQASTWPSRIVPGIDSGVGADVVVPPGISILLDVANVTLGCMQIKGFLKVLDDPSLPVISVKANSILVEGQLSVGTPTRQFSQKIKFELTPNSNNFRTPLYFSSFLPADPIFPRNLGHKAFAVVGGQVHFHGLPFPSTTPVWCRLLQNAQVNDTSISVDSSEASKWPVGGEIVVASTDYQMNQAEVFTITRVSATSTGATIFLDKPFKYMHWGQPMSLMDGFGGYVNEQAEVALLSRNIQITGTDEPEPYQLEGGHFIIFMTNVPQFIEGVEFSKMGQQGNLGRYSLHFHVVGNVPNTVCRKNTIRDSKQRCIVVHASHNITVESNIAYNTSGHCFMVEEGSEVNNTFIRNVGILTNAVVKKIPLSSNPTESEETDDDPSTFWVSSATNNFIQNVAAGSANSGFWIELRRTVRGMSLQIPSLNRTDPFLAPLGEYSGNTAHSNAAFGFRLYPHGNRPRNGDGSPAPGTISGLNVYKNSWMGMFIHNVDYLSLENMTSSDNYWGVMLNQGEATTIQNSRIIALTNNVGNPSQCYRTDLWADCKPVVGCSMPLTSTRMARSTGGVALNASMFGVLVDQGNRSSPGDTPISIVSTRFSNFSSTCGNSAAIALVGNGDLWNPYQSTKNITFTSDTNKIWIAPKISAYNPWNSVQASGEQSQFYALWDKDGSIVGRPGYVVANNDNILPPNKTGCAYNVKWNAYGCAATCYRTVQINYFEPGFAPGWAAVNNTRGSFSSLRITRDIDQKSFILDGNLNQFFTYAQADLTQRFFHFTVLANYTYSVDIIPSYGNPNFIPVNITISDKDGKGCGSGLTLRFQPMMGFPWTLTNSNLLFLKQCANSGLRPPSTSTTVYSYACVKNQSWLEIAMAPTFGKFQIIPANNTAVCSVDQTCSLLWSGASDWLYLDDGREVGPDFYNPIANTTAWKTGVAPIGFTTWGSDYIVTTVSQPSVNIVTYLYRRSFSIKDSLCYSSINIEVIVQDGIVVYLNNQEIIRAGMPQTTITNSTVASAITPAFTWTTFNINLSGTDSKYSLLEGRNVIAIEQHVFATWAWQLGMDMRISAVRKNDSCSGAVKLPEVCDGLDNNFNGKVDEGDDGTPLKMACKTACGNGIATCIGGKYVCNIRSPTLEICNGIDDNCDGAVDNGNQQLNCGTGQVCFRGKCLSMGNATQSVLVWPRNSTRWSYYDKGGDLDSISPSWRNGSKVSEWSVGQAPLGFNDYIPTWDWAKTTINNFGNDGISMTAYFSKQFNLTQSEVDGTFSLDFNVRRVDGAVIYLNGVELFRTNMPDGPISYRTTASGNTQGQESSPGSNCCNLQWIYYPCTSCFRNSSLPLKAGVNWIAAEVHFAWRWEKQFAFDMDLFRNVKQPCTSGECVRKVTQTLIPANDVWQYLDGSLPLPPSNWTQQNFTAANWKTGISPLGVGPSWLLRTNANWGGNVTYPRPTFYFRKVIQIPDANCLFQIDSSLLSNDGAVVYINGREVFRYSLPAGSITSDTFAFYGGDWQYRPFILSGGWLNVGANVIAVELHRAESSKQNMFFDLQMMGSREALTCSPLPV